MDVTYIPRDEALAVVTGKVHQVRVALNLGSGMCPHPFAKKTDFHICVDPHKLYINRAKSEVGDDPKYVFINAQWDEFILRLADKSVDSVFVLDILAHLEKEQGTRILQEAERVARKQIVVYSVDRYWPKSGDDSTQSERVVMGGGDRDLQPSGGTIEDLDGEWDVFGCQNYIQLDENNNLLETPKAAIWAFRNLDTQPRSADGKNNSISVLSSTVLKGVLPFRAYRGLYSAYDRVQRMGRRAPRTDKSPNPASRLDESPLNSLPASTPLSIGSLKEAVDSIPHWHHSIDLGNGIVTPGLKPLAQLEREAAQLPDVRGKSVLDIGAFDGWFSFEAERRGAARVVSLDHFMWAWDMEASNREQKEGEPYRPPEETEFFDLEVLPGKQGYDLAHEALGSHAESVVCDYMKFEGQFDVCLYLGVLYHMMAPFLALQKVAELTGEVAMIETAATYFPGLEHVPLCEFYDRDELLGADPTNYWAPNLKGLVSMCHAAGFKKVEVKVGPPSENILRLYAKTETSVRNLLRGRGSEGHAKTPVFRYRAIVHAWK